MTIKLWHRETITKRKKLKVIGLMKDELGGKIMTEFVRLIPNTYSYLRDDCGGDKKDKGPKNT